MLIIKLANFREESPSPPPPEIRGWDRNFSKSHGPHIGRVLVFIFPTYFFIFNKTFRHFSHNSFIFLHISFILSSPLIYELRDLDKIRATSISSMDMKHGLGWEFLYIFHIFPQIFLRPIDEGEKGVIYRFQIYPSSSAEIFSSPIFRPIPQNFSKFFEVPMSRGRGLVISGSRIADSGPSDNMTPHTGYLILVKRSQQGVFSLYPYVIIISDSK